MVGQQLKLDDINTVEQFIESVCSQCELCFRSPKDPALFCFPKFVADKSQFVEEFILEVVHARQKGRPIDKYRRRATFKKIFCNWRHGACATKHHNCGKKRIKKCYRRFSNQVLNLEVEEQKGKATNEVQNQNKQDDSDDDSWYETYGYGQRNYNYSSKKTPNVTVIGKKKFQNKVEKILNENTD